MTDSFKNSKEWLHYRRTINRYTKAVDRASQAKTALSKSICQKKLKRARLALDCLVLSNMTFNRPEYYKEMSEKSDSGLTKE